MGTYTKFYKREEFQIENLIQIFTKIINLEEVPRLEFLHYVCYFIYYLQDAVNS